MQRRKKIKYKGGTVNLKNYCCQVKFVLLQMVNHFCFATAGITIGGWT